MSRLFSYTRFFNVNDIQVARPEEDVIDATVVWIQARVKLPVMVTMDSFDLDMKIMSEW